MPEAEATVTCSSAAWFTLSRWARFLGMTSSNRSLLLARSQILAERDELDTSGLRAEEKIEALLTFIDTLGRPPKGRWTYRELAESQTQSLHFARQRWAR